MLNSDNSDVFAAITSRQRLADISHHFLSSKEDSQLAWRKTRIVPLLLVSKADDYVAYLLKQAFEEQRRSCVVLNVETQGNLGLPQTAGDTAAARMPEICLLPLTSTGTTVALQHNKLLLAVPTSLPGVRLAYHLLAQLAAQAENLTVQVIMLDARDAADAQRYFNFLSDSAASLLCVKLKLGGFLRRRHTTSGEQDTADLRTALCNLLDTESTPAPARAQTGSKPRHHPAINVG